MNIEDVMHAISKRQPGCDETSPTENDDRLIVRK
jgi:hypothetical protein